MSEFLSKDPQKALDEVKEKLYTRLSSTRNYIGRNINSMKYAYDSLDKVELHTERQYLEEEARFLEILLDIIERS